MDELRVLDFVVGHLERYREIRRIVLFGSRARGEADVESDFDICLFVEGVSDPRELHVTLMREIASPEWSIDLMILTEADFQLRLAEGWSVIRAIERDGRTLYAA
ncbi:MAG: nucleotidyltransferase domain-containing protein [Spirochaetota bacterium]